MPARLTAYPPESAAERFALSGPGPHRIGRADDCSVQLAHASVSRRHAALELLDAGWRLRDDGSKNGSFVDGLPTDGGVRHGPAWLRFGDVACELEIIDESALAKAQRESERRRDAATALTLAIDRDPARPDLMEATLDAIIDLAGAERGVLLLAEGDGLVPKAWRGFDRGAEDPKRFSGSHTAVDRAVASRRAVVAHDLSLDRGLADRASVVAGGLRALACLPLVLGNEVLGVAYVDSQRAGAVVTRLDLELLEAFAERATLWLAARRNQAALAAQPGGPRPGGPHA